MTPKQRLTVLFDLWAKQIDSEGADETLTSEELAEARAAHLIELDSETDGEKLFSKAGDSLQPVGL